MRISLLCTIFIHALLLFGLGLHSFEQRQQKQQLNVTLLPNSNQQIPTKALLEAKQNNSGAIIDKPVDTVTQVQSVPQLQMKRIAENKFTVQSNNLDEESLAQSRENDHKQLLETSLEENPGEPKFGQPIPLMSRAISPSTHESKDAEYLAKWQADIELIGNQNYPLKAIEQSIQGSLRLLVAINQDGSVRNIDLRRSSGHPILDEAAIAIVKKTAPFDPIPAYMLGNSECLEIINTWQFTGKDFSRG